MRKYIYSFDEYKAFEVVDLEKKPGKLDIDIDPDTGEKVIDKSQVSPKAIIKSMAGKLYKSTIEMGRFQSKMNDKIQKLQQAGGDEGMIGQYQQVLQDQMMGMQTAAMDLEMGMMSAGGQNMQMQMYAQKLSGEAKMLANKANKEYFDKKVKKFEKDTEKQLIAAQKAEAQKQQEKAKEKSKGDKKDDDLKK